jgi:antitoxin StbD
MLLDRADQAISSTDLQKNTKTLLDRIASGEQDRYVVIRDNRPAAVLMPTEKYEAIMNELEDLRVEALARDRLATLEKATSIPHADMLDYFGKPD